MVGRSSLEERSRAGVVSRFRAFRPGAGPSGTRTATERRSRCIGDRERRAAGGSYRSKLGGCSAECLPSRSTVQDRPGPCAEVASQAKSSARLEAATCNHL
jgi:hypothetical protein